MEIEAKQPVTDVGYLDEESLAVLPAVMVVITRHRVDRWLLRATSDDK